MHAHSRRVFVRLAAGAAGVIALSACTSASPTPGAPSGGAPTSAPAAGGAAASKPMTLSFPSWQQDEPGSSVWWKARIAEFQTAHPNVTIEFTKVSVNEHADKLLTQFAAGSPPQIVHVPYLNLIPFADKGFLEPLDDYFKQSDIGQSWSPLQSGTVWKGQSFALLLLAYGYSMIYNEQLLKEAGVDIPKSGPDFVKAAKTLTKKPDQFGFGTPTTPGFNLFTFLSTFIIGNGGRVADETKVTVNSPEAVEGVSWWVDLVKSSATPTGTDTGPLRQLLGQGKLALWFDGPWGQGFVNMAAEAVKPNLKVERMPFKKVFGGSSNVIAIPTAIPADQKQMVWEFIKSLSTPAAQRDYTLKYCTPSARKDAEVAPADLHASCPLIDTWVESLNSPDLVDYFPRALATKTSEMTKMVSDTAQTLITSDASVSTELDKLQTQLEGLQKA